MALSMDQLDDIHACIDAMTQAVGSCKSGEWTVEEMWLEIDAQSQALSALAADTGADADEDEEEDDEGDSIAEINFDEDEESEGGDSFADEDEEF